MQKGNLNFKEIRKKVVYNQVEIKPQNAPVNPMRKISFKGIKRNQENIPHDSNKKILFMSPIKLYSPKKQFVPAKQDCKKFSTLLESKGLNNSNCGSARKKSTDLSFRMLNNNTSTNKSRLNTERSEKTNQLLSKVDLIQRKCKQIKQRQYFHIKPKEAELQSLYKLKNYEYTIRQKCKNQCQNQTKQHSPNLIEHSSIMSEHDLVNMSKQNSSVDFDMSPWI